jgi:flagellar P-ring protein precursor FlgI
MIAFRSVAAATLMAGVASGEVRVKDVTHWKGQRINRVSGLGLIIGLAGTGDGKAYGTAINALAKLQQNFGAAPRSRDDLTAKNVAVVMVEAELPEDGVKPGQRVNAKVRAIGAAKSLKSGALLMTPLSATHYSQPLAYASGNVHLPDEDSPNNGVVTRGAVFENEFTPEYVTDGQVVLILDQPDGFAAAQAIADVVNQEHGHEGSPPIATAVDPQSVDIQIPRYEMSAIPRFLAEIEGLPLIMPEKQKRIVINRRTQTISVTGDVEIEPGLVAYKGMTITVTEPASPPSPETPLTRVRGFVPLDSSSRGGARLRDLLEVLDQLKAPARDKIDILENYSRSGRLNAKIVWVE